MIKLAEDQTQPAIARATAIWMLQSLNHQTVYSVARKLLSDKEPLVRYHSLGVYAMLSKNQKISLIGPLLNDPVRAVRIEAANQLSDVKIEEFPAELRSSYGKAFTEFKEYLKMHSDSAGGQVNISNFHSRQNTKEQAITALKKAIKIDNHFNMARINLAFMLSMDQKYDEAEAVYKKVIEQEPQYAQAWYSLGLLYSEQNKFEQAVDAFSKAITRDPRNLRIYYNKALCLQKLGLSKEAEKTFIDGLSGEVPKDQNAADLFYGLIMLQLDMKQMERASQTISSFVLAFGQNHPYMKHIGRKMQELQRAQQQR